MNGYDPQPLNHNNAGIIDCIVKLGRSLCSKETVEVDGISYNIKEKLGEGGFSIVELLEHPRTKKLYALKRITCHSTEDQINATKEIEYHRQLGSYGASRSSGQEQEDNECLHPGSRHILGLVGSRVVGNADIVHNKSSEVLLVLPYLKRGTLKDELQRRELTKDPFAEGIILSIFLQICDGLMAFHQALPQPLAHRDLNPQNILLTQDLTPVIMDLGSVELARVQIDTHSQAQHLQDIAAEKSTISYRPPELFQVSSKCKIDERTDIWSLGCLLYAMCFYKSPFDLVWERGDSVALAVQSGSNNLHFPSSIKGGQSHSYSSGLKKLIQSMLEGELSSRPHLVEVMETATVLSEASEDQV